VKIDLWTKQISYVMNSILYHRRPKTTAKGIQIQSDLLIHHQYPRYIKTQSQSITANVEVSRKKLLRLLMNKNKKTIINCDH